MRLNWQQINDYQDPFGRVFQSGGSEAAPMATPWLSWKSELPDLTTLGDSVLSNPNIGSMFGSQEHAINNALQRGFEDALNPLMEHIGQLVMHDFVQGTRQTLGQMVQNVGILSSAFSNIYTIFSTPIRSVEDAFRVVDVALEQSLKALEMALNGISAIPIVGWIIRIVYEVAKSVANIVIASRQESADTARRMMAKQLTIPFSSTEFDPQTDDLVTKAFFDKVGRALDPKSIISPQFRVNTNSICPPKGFKSHSGFCADGVRRKSGDDIAAGWVVNPAITTGGLGFVPGTSSITAGFYFPAKNGGLFKDMGSLYPTASNLCTGWWANITKPGPSMFSVAPLASKNEWEDYMESLFAFSQRELPKGWASNGMAIKFTDKFDCTSDVYGVGSCKKSKNGKRLRIPKDMGLDAHRVFYAYLLRLFFGVENPYSASLNGLNQVPHIGNLDDPKRSYQDVRGKRFWNNNGINFSEAVPIRSLDDLYSRQKATLQSMQCMYVNGEDSKTFPAFTNSNLRREWAEGVTEIFASGAWRRVVFRDMPEGSAKKAFAQHAAKHGIKDIENYNRPCAPGEPLANCGQSGIKTTISAAPGIPEAPGLPTPPMNNVVVKAAVAKSVSNGKKKKESKLPLVLAVGAIGLLIASNRK